MRVITHVNGAKTFNSVCALDYMRTCLQHWALVTELTNFDLSGTVFRDWRIHTYVTLFVDVDDGALGLVGAIPAVLQPVAAFGLVDAVAAVASELVVPALKWPSSLYFV